MDVVDFAKHVYKSLQEREDELARALVVGTPKDWEHYKMIVGEIQGLSFAAGEIKTLLERHSDYDDGFDESG
jgi:hypothetical protein